MQDTKNLVLDCVILIVEDNFLTRQVLKEIFIKQGFRKIIEAENGKVALEKMAITKPDIVILDVMMPEMDGIECCKAIRSSKDPKIANVPILFQTALDASSDKSRFFAAGATDYVSKPIDNQEIVARAVVHLERGIMFNNLHNYKMRMADELSIARSSQQVLVPEKKKIYDMEQAYHLQISGHYEACSELGGDFWGFRSISSDELAVYMVDFAGHGVNAALNVFRLHALMQAATDTAHFPSAYLTSINAHLATLLAPGQFATMFYGIIDCKNNILSYASAAAPEALIFREGGKPYQILESTGTVLGAVKDATYHMVEVEFNAGDSLFIYSDALVETPQFEGDLVPIEKWIDFIESVRKNHPKDSSKITENLITEFMKKCANQLKDDLTISCYSRNL